MNRYDWMKLHARLQRQAAQPKRHQRFFEAIANAFRRCRQTFLRLCSRLFACRLAFVWLLLLLSCGIALHLKHPQFLPLRPWETPALLTLALLSLGFARVCWKKSPRRSLKKLEAGARGILAVTLLALVVGQEALFAWQRYWVLQADVAMTRMGRHFVVGFRDFAEITPLAERGLIGGIYLTRRNLKDETAASLKTRIEALQALRRDARLPPLFVMADQEGGVVESLSPLIESMPSLATLTRRETKDDTPGDFPQGAARPDNLPSRARARAYGERQGKALAALGVNMNLSPVVDLKRPNSGKARDRHSYIERRAIAADADTVIRVASAYGAGLLAQGVLPTVKHFPGLGGLDGDTHLTRVRADVDAATRQEAWRPFVAVTRQTGAAMMLSHAILPEIDPERPASLSRKLVQDVLRNPQGWNFQGILVTDDLNMGAVYAEGIGRAATRAPDAGVDLILVSYDPDQYYRALHAAARGWRVGGIDSRREVASAIRLDRFWAAFCKLPARCGEPSRQPAWLTATATLPEK